MKYSKKINHSSPNNWLLFQLVFIALCPSTATLADTMAPAPLFLTTSVKPNIMLMVDNSMSMTDPFVIAGVASAYDPAMTYLSTASCTTNSLSNTNTLNSSSTCAAAGYSWSSSTCTISGKTSTTCQPAGGTWTNIGSTRTPNNVCKITSANYTYSTTIPSTFFGNGTGTKCFSSSISYTTSLSVPTGMTTTAQRANWLNWYYSNQLAQQGTASDRLAVVKNASTSLIDNLSNNVRVGLSTFNSNSGGTLYEVIDDLVTQKKTNIKSRINAIGGAITLTSTPLAGTMANIGRYFATGYTGNLTLHPDTSPSTAAVASVFPTALTNSTAWLGRTAIAGEPTFATNPIQYSCQKSFNVVITDGLPSSDRAISNNASLQDYDGDCTGTTNSAKCTNFDMKKAYPYPGGNGATPNLSVANAGSNSSDYFDDVTQAMYEIDLRPDLIKTGGAINNITTYVVGLADDAINPTMPGVNPLPKEAAEHAGGKFYFAGSQSELTASLLSAFNFIAEQDASSSSVATNSTQFQTDTLIYQAVFDSSNWSGDLLAYKLTTEDTNGNGKLDTEDKNGNGGLDTGEDTNGNGKLDTEDTNGNGKIDAGAIGAQLWSASIQLPAVSDRNIYSYNPLATTTKGIELLWGNLNSTQKQILDNTNINNTSSPILDYLRGEQDKEKNKSNGIYRNRSSILGDIVGSDPLYVAHDNAGYAILPEGSTYTAFVTPTTPRREMIYVAANDGMLHGFDASITAAGGKEIFAYLPNAAITSSLVTLTEPNYKHIYLNDGAPQAGDAYYDGGWHTVLVGGLGAGGKALYALDITDPEAFLDTSTGAGQVLWEFTETDLGYTLPQASIVRTAASGQWAAIVANGYQSTSGKAVLYVIDIKTGAIIKKIEAGTASTGNGLSSSVTVDVDNDKIADYVYAGDLKGNMWKFDISSSNIANWGVANNGSPLFIATDAANPAATQAITSKPAASKATGTGQTSGTMLYFGTGKYFDTGDDDVPDNPQIQNFYAIWDVCDKNSAAGCNGVVSGRTSLQQQSIIYEGSSGTTTLTNGATVSGDVRVTSSCEVAYGSTVPTTTTSPCTTNINRRGWYLDLLSPSGAQGERVVSTPVIRHGVVIFPTLIPITTICTPGGTSWLMELDQFSGAPLSGGTPIDLNNDGIVDDKDLIKIGDKTYAASGFKSTVGIIDTPAIINCEDGMDCKYASGSSGKMIVKKETAPKNPVVPPVVPPAPIAGHRTSWRQLQ